MRAALRRLPGLVAVAGAGAAVIGLLWRPSGHPVSVVTARGQSAQLAEDGLYRYDTVFIAAGNTAVDAVVLALGIPLVVAAWLQFRAGSPRGSLLLTGALGFLLYVYATYAFGVAYNPLFLVYVALMAATLFGFIAAFAATDRAALAAAAADPGLPHRFLSRFLLSSAAVTAVVWLQPLVTALLRGRRPSADRGVTLAASSGARQPRSQRSRRLPLP
jgi:predicted cation transporter